MIGVMTADWRLHEALARCYCLGQADYGRETPFAAIAPYIGWEPARIGGLVRLATEFRYLPLGDKRWSERTNTGLDWLAEVEVFLDALGPVIDGYEAVLRQAA